MKKLKRISWILLAVTSVLMIVVNGYSFITKDKEPPVITFPDQELVVSVSVSEEELLKDVKAQDDKSGDLSSSVVVERMSSIDEEMSRVITYAAIDEAGNVGRKERTIRYTDYTKPRFKISEPLRFPLGKMLDNIIANVQAESSVDGDISEKLKFQFTGEEHFDREGVIDIEIRVSDSAGVSSVLPTKLELYDPKTETLKVKLNQYIVYLTKNSDFDPSAYYVASGQKEQVQIESDVNTSVPGTYHVNYLVQSGNSLGKSRLIVVVE